MSETLQSKAETPKKRPRNPPSATLRNSLSVFFALLIALAFWSTLHQTKTPSDWTGSIAGIAYSPYQRWHQPTGSRPQAINIAHDIQQLSQITTSLRTYSMHGYMDALATLAADSDVRLLTGAWIGVNSKHDERELSSLIALAQAQKNVTRLLVGNEVLLRNALSPHMLQKHINAVRAATKKPASTAEPWHVWLEYPDLAETVDFLAVHILPYWEGVHIDQAIPYIDRRLKELQTAYPNKPILLAEVGWPADGKSIGAAKASRINQASFVRTFLAYAEQNNTDYVLLEAYDQPWKTSIEGKVGGHWGILDSHRREKWPMTGSVEEYPHWPYWAFGALLLGVLIQTIYFRHSPDLSIKRGTLVGVSFHAWSAAMFWLPITLMQHYLGIFELMVWVTLIVSQCLLYALFASDLVELANVRWRKLRRQFDTVTSVPSENAPFVSIHLPCSDEPPDIVRRTLISLSQLIYPNFEVIVISNNCSDQNRWRPLEIQCAQLGPRFRFIHRDQYPGFKAGALNLARTLANKATEIVAVVDSDYLVDPDWLNTLIPLFKDTTIALVQAPQDHHLPVHNGFKRACFWEYAGFFQIGMLQRNEADAIIQHGTMTLIRSIALDEVDGWGEWCITEDAELGLRLLAAGWRSAYIPRSFGRGLLPDEFRSYKEQRFRWVFGAMQILKRHGLALVGLRPSQLNIAQRYHFIAGWLPWLADAGGFLFTLCALVWTLVMTIKPDHFPPPIPLFLAPVLVLFIAKHVRVQLLYSMRIDCKFLDRLRAALAGLALGHTVARAVLLGLATNTAPFKRTPKGASHARPRESFKMVRTEGALFVAITAAFIAFSVRCDLNETSAFLWLLVLSVQAAPYLAALLMASIDAAGRRQISTQTGTVDHIADDAHSA